MDAGGIEQPVFISNDFAGGLNTERLAVHKKQRYKQREDHSDNADTVDGSVR